MNQAINDYFEISASGSAIAQRQIAQIETALGVAKPERQENTRRAVPTGVLDARSMGCKHVVYWGADQFNMRIQRIKAGKV